MPLKKFERKQVMIMMNKDLEKIIYAAAERDVPNVQASIMAEYRMKKAQNKHRFGFRLPLRPLQLASMMLILLIIGFVAMYDHPVQDSYATVYIDINPSLEFDIDEEDIIRDARLWNDEATLLLADVDYMDQPLYDVLDDIVDQAITLNYLNEDHPYIILDIANREEHERINTLALVENRMKHHASDRVPNFDIIRGNAQNIQPDEQSGAHNHNMSMQRWRIIQSIVEENSDLDVEDLIDKNIGELMKVMQEKNMPNMPGMRP